MGKKWLTETEAYNIITQCDVVLGMKPVNKEDVDPFEAIIEEVKHAKGVKLDNELEVLCVR